MGKIIYKPHLQRRLKERKIPHDYPRIIYKQSELHYFDNETGYYIAVAKLRYAEKIRHLVCVYDKIGETIEIITIFPIAVTELKNKINSRRWVKKENRL